MDSALHLLGIARKAGRVEVGEEPAGAACRARQAKLLLVAADAAENSVRRAAHFAQAGKTLWLRTPYTKGELGGAAGRGPCAMLALTDAGLAAALAEKLSQADPEAYGPAAAELSEQAARVLQRQREKRAHEKKLERAGRKPWAMAAPAGKRPGGPAAGKKRKQAP